MNIPKLEGDEKGSNGHVLPSLVLELISVYKHVNQVITDCGQSQLIGK
jgi:hypothetical protein